MVKASDLVKEQQEKDKNRRKVFKTIYKRIETKISQSSNMNLYECWYEIPEFILNIPLYKLNECKQYLTDKLKSDGFHIKWQNNIILISWKVTK